MAKKQRSSAAAAAAASAESPSPDAAMDSPAPAAAAPASSSTRVRSSKSKAASASSSSSPRRSPNPHATFNLPRGWESNPGVAAAESDLSCVAKEVPDPAYLQARIAPQNRLQRWARRVLWTWKIHGVVTMLDPFEVALLTFITVGMLIALGTYLASFASAL